MNEPTHSHPPSFSLAANAQYSDLYYFERSLKDFEYSLRPEGDVHDSFKSLYLLLDSLLPIFKKIYSST
jgi:hypothetical protein